MAVLDTAAILLKFLRLNCVENSHSNKLTKCFNNVASYTTFLAQNILSLSQV